MTATAADKRQAYLDKTRAEAAALASRGVVMAGNAFSPVLFVKGEPNEAESAGAPVLSGPDGDALRAALAALGYAPQDWAAVLCRDAQGAPLSPGLLRAAVDMLDPATLIALDETAAGALRDAFAAELVEVEDLARAMLSPGETVDVLGMRTMNLGGFEAALGDGAAKQVMWARLKRLPPLGAPY